MEKKYAIICNDGYGIFFGIIKKFDQRTGVATVTECRHVARWFGREGGITSLATYGLCGERKGESRIGGAAPRAELTRIKNVFFCTTEAAQTIIKEGK